MKNTLFTYLKSKLQFKNIINDKDDSIAKPIKMSISFKDSRKMCSFGFRYTFGCPENLYKTNFAVNYVVLDKIDVITIIQ